MSSKKLVTIVAGVMVGVMVLGLVLSAIGSLIF